MSRKLQKRMKQHKYRKQRISSNNIFFGRNPAFFYKMKRLLYNGNGKSGAFVAEKGSDLTHILSI